MKLGRKTKRILGASLVLAALIALVHSGPAKEAARRLLVRGLGDLVEGEVSIARLDYRLWRGELDLDGLEVVPDDGSYRLRARNVRIQITGLPRAGIDIDEPELSVLQLPDGSNETVGGAPLAFLRYVSALRIHGGAFELFDNLDFAGVDADLLESFEEYRLTLHAPRGRIGLPEELNVGPLDVDALLAPERIRIDSASLYKDASFVRAEGEVTLAGPLSANLQFDTALEASLARLLSEDLELRGIVTATGRASFHDDLPYIEAHFRSEELGFREVAVRDVAGHCELEDGVIQIRDLEGEAFRGRLAVEASLSLNPNGSRIVDLSWEDVDPGDVASAVADWPLPLSSRSGGSMHFVLDDFSARGVTGLADLRLTPVTSTTLPSGSGTLTASLGSGIVTFSPSTLELTNPRARVNLGGTVGLDGSVDLGISASVEPGSFAALPFRADGAVDLDASLAGNVTSPTWSAKLSSRQLLVEDEPIELAGTIVGGLESATVESLSLDGAGGRLALRGIAPLDRKATWSLELSGSEVQLPPIGPLRLVVADVSGHVEGPADSPDVTASVWLDPVSFGDRRLPEALVTARACGGQVAIAASFDGTSLLDGDLSLRAPFPLHLEADLAVVPWTDLARASGLEISPAFDVRAEGIATLDADLSDLRGLRYEASLEGLAVTTWLGTASSSPASIEGDLDGLTIHGLDLTGPHGRLSLSGTVPFVETREMDVTIDARLPLETLREFAPALEAQGEATAELTLTGSLNDPHLVGDLRIADSNGRFKDLVWNDVSLIVETSRDRVDHVELSGNLLDGRIELRGQIPLSTRGAPGRIELALHHVDLAPLLYDQRGEDVAVLASLRGEIDVAGLALSELSGSGEIDELSLRARGRDMELGEPSSWRFDGERLNISPMTLRGEGSALTLSPGTLAWGAEPRVDASVIGEIDLSVIDALLVDIPELSVEGQAEITVEAAYSKEGWNLSGTGRLDDGALTLARPRFALSNIAAGLSLEGPRIVVTELSASTGRGTLRGEGFADLGGEKFSLDLRAEAQRLPLELMDGLRIETSGSIELASADDGYRISGDLSLDRGLLTREVDDEDMDFSSQQAALRDPTQSAGLADRLTLDVTITTRRNLVVENSMAQLELAGNITLGGTLTDPEVGGIITVLPDGALRIGRNRFEVRQGRADLRGFPLAPPRLDIVAVTRVGQTLIQIELDGDADDLRTHLTAPENPNLTEGDLASLLVTGRTLEQAGEGGQQIASTWMMASLADLVHEGLGDLITYGPPPGAGPLILAEEADPTSRLTLGVPVTQRLSATYSIALNDAEKRLWILDYRVARNVWLRGIQEDSSDYALGVSQRFDFDFRGRARAQRAVGEASGSGERLAEVSVRGAPEHLDWKPDVRAGERFDYWGAQDEARRLTRRLVEMGFPSAVVDARTESDDAQRVSLVFDISPGRPTTFVWSGDDPGKKLRGSIERAWDGRIPETFLLPDLAERARTDLAARRYYLARVEARIEDDRAERRIIFDVERGPQGGDLEIHFQGNAALDQKTLRDILPPSDDPGLFRLLARRAELERGIRLRYAAEGYLDAAVGDLKQNYDPTTGTLRVTIPVEEGPITRVTSVNLTGNTNFDESALESVFGVVLGDAVDFPEIRRGEGRLRTFYREAGFPDVQLRTALSRTVEGLEIGVGIEEGARARVGDIRVVDNIRTREAVIRNELTFEEGDPVRITDFQESQKRLYDLGILRTADVRVEPAQQGRLRQDVIVQVSEKPDLDVNYGVRYNVLNKKQSLASELEPKGTSLEGLARVNVVNPVGFGSSLGLSIFFEKDHQLFRGTFRLPLAFGKRVITELVLDTERDQDRLDIPGFDLRRDSVTFQQTKKLRDLRYDKLALQWNVSYARYRGQTIDENTGAIVGLEAHRPRFGISFIDDRRDSFANPTRGRFWNVTLNYTPAIWGSDVSYYRLYGQFFYYHSIGGRWVWASGVRLGFAPGDRPFLLIDDRFQAGGANSVRGFAQTRLGPSVTVPETGEEVSIGGQAVGVFNQELRFPLHKSLHGAVFWDAGNVFARASDFRLSDLRQSVGAGIRYVLSFGAVRLDWAHVIAPREGESSSRFHFSFGYAF